MNIFEFAEHLTRPNKSVKFMAQFLLGYLIFTHSHSSI